jgi:hypothetical protein
MIGSEWHIFIDVASMQPSIRPLIVERLVHTAQYQSGQFIKYFVGGILL